MGNSGLDCNTRILIPVEKGLYIPVFVGIGQQQWPCQTVNQTQTWWSRFLCSRTLCKLLILSG